MTSVCHEDDNLELVSGSGDYKLSPTLVMVALLECHRDKSATAVASDNSTRRMFLDHAERLNIYERP